MFSRLSDNQDMRVFADILTRGVSVFLFERLKTNFERFIWFFCTIKLLQYLIYKALDNWTVLAGFWTVRKFRTLGKNLEKTWICFTKKESGKPVKTFRKIRDNMKIIALALISISQHYSIFCVFHRYCEVGNKKGRYL